MVARLRAIGDVAEELSLSTRTIRYYEELGLLGEVRRRGGRRRVYGEEEVARLRFIGKLKLLGLSLEEIAELNDVHARGSTRGMLERLVPKLDARLADLDHRLHELAQLKTEIQTYRGRMERRLQELRR
jgi:MerR family transcriptional regulator, repressor of the yfmOP operon